MENKTILSAVCGAIHSFNEQLPANRRLSATLKCQLVGSPNLDSVDLVNLLVMIEQRVEDDLGISVSLFDGTTSEQGVEGFVTVEALVESLSTRIADAKVQH